MFPGESAEYRAARDQLLEQEIELRALMERVAVARRALPPGGIVPEDYVFNRGDATEVRLSELFAPGNVFHRRDGAIRHFWGSELIFAPTESGQEPRHVGTIEPLWNLFDLTPEGRGSSWDEQLQYA